MKRCRKKAKQKIGFSNLKYAITGAAPINPDILHLFHKLDIPLFEGYGSVITSGRCAAKDGTRLAVTAETTTVRQDDANVLPQLNFLNGTTVPVEDVMKQAGGGEAGPEVYLDTFYLDDEMRISKLEDGSVFVYQRCSAPV